MEPNNTTNQQVAATPDILQVRILSPKKMIFLGQASSLSSNNSAGKFDILAQHANFITLIKNTPLYLIKDNGETLTFKFNLAIILAVNNIVTVYSDISDLSQVRTH